MSGLSLTATIVFGPKPTLPTPPSRRRLAQNVVCLFDDDRSPVANVRCRGRLPRSIVRFSMPPLAVGDVAEIFFGGTNPNNGRQVKIVGYHPDDGDFCVEAMSGTLHTFDNDHNPTGQSRRAYCPPKKLRRVPKTPRQSGLA